MPDENHLLELPPCGFCGKLSDEVRRFYKSISVDFDSRVFHGAICSDCVRIFMFTTAHEDREKFERLVDEVRAYKPPAVEPENSN
jgi:hypothetical protein